MCANGVVEISPPPPPFQLCFDNICKKISTNESQLRYVLPPSPVHDLTKVKLISEHVIGTRLCRTAPFCEHVSNFLSKSLLANPHCWPSGALFSVAVIAFSVITGLSLLLWLFFRKKPTQGTSTTDTTQIELQVNTTQQEHAPFTLSSFTPALLQPSHAMDSLPLRWSPLRYPLVKTVDLTCTQLNACHYEYRREILFNKVTTSLCVQLRHANISVGYIKVQRRPLRLECLKNTLFWTRDTKYYVRHMTRCRGMGSCTDTRCETLAPNDSIPELRQFGVDPGYTACSIQCSGVNCVCVLPFRACTFYRVAHTPISSQPYEIFTCQAWKPTVHLDVSVRLYNTQYDENLALQPYLTREFAHFAFTVISIQKPHISFHQKFARSDSETIELSEDFSFPVTCHSESQARTNFSTCTNMHFCDCDVSGFEPSCRCPHDSLNSLRNSSNFLLPLSTPHIALSSRNSTVIAESDESEIILAITSHMRLDDAHLRIKTPCAVQAGSLEGCYNCKQGSKVNISCHTYQPSWTTIVCEHNIFSIECSPDNKTTTVKMTWDRAIVASKCYTICDNRNISVEIHGVLYYHSHQDRFKDVFLHNSIRHIPQTDWFKDAHIPDFSPLWKVAVEHWKVSIAAISVVAIGILLSYLLGPVVILSSLRALIQIIALAIPLITATIHLLIKSVTACAHGLHNLRSRLQQ
ncbi:hypothetical protein COOONC_00061 [Cooperia oncophora]